MSNDYDRTSLHEEPSDRKVLYSAIGWVGVLFLFALIVIIAYVPNRAGERSQDFRETRFAIKQQVEAEQTRKVQGYAWENQAEGVVRIPVSRAMNLVVNELQSSNGGETEASAAQ